MWKFELFIALHFPPHLSENLVMHKIAARNIIVYTAFCSVQVCMCGVRRIFVVLNYSALIVGLYKSYHVILFYFIISNMLNMNAKEIIHVFAAGIGKQYRFRGVCSYNRHSYCSYNHFFPDSLTNRNMKQKMKVHQSGIRKK